MTSCLFPLWMGQIMYNMFRLGFCLIKKKKKKKKKKKGFVSNGMRPIALCQDITVSSSLAQLQIPKILASDK